VPGVKIKFSDLMGLAFCSHRELSAFVPALSFPLFIGSPWAAPLLSAACCCCNS
jgi:hypothetical protein